jgi:hypothetical protein
MDIQDGQDTDQRNTRSDRRTHVFAWVRRWLLSCTTNNELLRMSRKTFNMDEQDGQDDTSPGERSGHPVHRVYPVHPVYPC